VSKAFTAVIRPRAVGPQMACAQHALADVVVRRVAEHVLVRTGAVQRVAPLVPLRHRQQLRRVALRRDHVHERHAQDGGLEGIRRDFVQGGFCSCTVTGSLQAGSG